MSSHRSSCCVLPLLPVLLALLQGCGVDLPREPRIEALTPTTLQRPAAAVLRISGHDFPPGPPGLRLLPSTGTVAPPMVLLQPTRLSPEQLLAVTPAGLAPGHYDLELNLPNQLPTVLVRALEVLPGELAADATGPIVWLSGPDPSAGVRPGSLVTIELQATDPSGVAEIGYTTSDWIGFAESRAVSSGGPRARATFRVPVPAELEPLQLFWVVPWARDRAGNEGLASYAATLIVCGDAGGENPVLPCPDEWIPLPIPR